MIRKTTLFLTMIITVIALSSGCGEKSTLTEEKEQEDVVIEPEYIPTLYEVAEEINEAIDIKSCGHMELTSQEDIVIYDTVERKYVILGQDNKKKEAIQCDEVSFGEVYTLDSKDHLYILAQKFANGDKEGEMQELRKKILIYDLEGNKQGEIPLDIVKVAEKNPDLLDTDIEVDGEGNIYILSSKGEIEKLDSSGNTIGKMPVKDGVFIEINEEGKVWVGGVMSKPFLYQVDIKAHQIIKKIEDNALSIITTGYYSLKEKALYIANQEGIQKYDQSGNYMGDVVRYAATELPDMVIGPRDILVNGQKEIFMTLFNSDSSTRKGMKLAISKNDPNIQEEESVSISIAVSGLDKVLEKAINNFGKKYPHIHFVIKESEEDTSIITSSDMTKEELDAVEKEASRKYNDYIKKLTTEMIAGKGADLIYIGGLPYYQLIEKNILANLDPLMKNDPEFQIEDYNKKVFDGMRYKGGLYAIPLTYRFPIMAVQKERLHTYPLTYSDQNWTWHDFDQFLKQLKLDSDGDGKNDLYTMPLIDIEQFFIESVVIPYSDTYLMDFEKKKASFDSPEFIELLELYKSLVDEKKMNDQIVYQMSQGDGQTWLEPGSLFDYALSIGSMQSELKGNLEILQYPTFDGSGVVPFSTNYLFGINSQSEYKEECWLFIKYLLSEEIQTYEQLFDFPVLNTAKQQKQKAAIEEYDQYREFFESDAGVQLDPIAEVIERINQLDEKVEGNTNIYDVYFEEIVRGELERFSQGEQNAEETAQAIQRKLWMYLNE